MIARKNQDDELLRLTYIAMAIGYMELATYFCEFIHPDALTDSKVMREMESKWLQDFIDKQPEGDGKEKLKKRIATHWPRLQQDKAGRPD